MKFLLDYMCDIERILEGDIDGAIEGDCVGKLGVF